MNDGIQVSAPEVRDYQGKKASILPNSSRKNDTPRPRFSRRQLGSIRQSNREAAVKSSRKRSRRLPGASFEYSRNRRSPIKKDEPFIFNDFKRQDSGTTC